IIKMSTMEENIPAFPMWKMFNDTVIVLIKGDYSEIGIKKLANIIQSKEYSNLFNCCKDPEVGFEQYQEIGEKYKAFTTWLLGQFFFLLGNERISKIHDIIIDTQLCILDQLSRTQLYNYNELANEYIKAFDLLIKYHKEPRSKLILEVFIPKTFDDLSTQLDLKQVFIEISSKEKCLLVIQKLVKLIKYILMESFLFYSFDDNTLKILQNLLYLFSEENIQLKLCVVEVFIEIFCKPRHEFQDYVLDIKRSWYKFTSLFEQLVYGVYNGQIELKENDIKTFESLLILYLKMDFHNKRNKGINNYIFKISSEIKPVIIAALQDLPQISLENYKHEIFKVVDAAIFRSSAAFYFYKDYILKEICEPQEDKVHANVYHTSEIWNEIKDYSDIVHYEISYSFCQMWTFHQNGSVFTILFKSNGLVKFKKHYRNVPHFCLSVVNSMVLQKKTVSCQIVLLPKDH
ncbi:hypothetical protein NQ317_002087, partial [Molorchus minor]